MNALDRQANPPMKIAESDFMGLGYGRVMWDDWEGDSSTLTIDIEDQSGDPPKQITIVGSIEIGEFFKLIDKVRGRGVR